MWHRLRGHLGDCHRRRGESGGHRATAHADNRQGRIKVGDVGVVVLYASKDFFFLIFGETFSYSDGEMNTARCKWQRDAWDLEYGEGNTV